MRTHAVVAKLAVVVAVSALLVLGSGGVARADCSTPSITFEPTERPRGGTVVVTGAHFYDECIDVFPTDEVAEPIEGIELVVLQGEFEWVVGRVNASQDFSFEAEIVVPTEARPGPAMIVARHDSTWGPTTGWNRPLQITSEPARSTSIDRAVTGPSDAGSAAIEQGAASTSDPNPAGSDQRNGNGSTPALVAAGLVGGLLIGAVVWRFRRMRSPTTENN